MGSKKPSPSGEGSIITILFPQRHGMVGWGVLALVLQCGGDKALEQRVGAVRAALELGVELGTQVEVTARNLDSLDQAAVRAGACNDQALFLKLGAELVVELIAVAMALVDVQCAVALGHPGARGDGAGVLAQAHRAALRLDTLLIRHQVNDVMMALGRKLAGILSLIHI